MMRGALTFSAIASVIFFPWPLTAILMLIASPVEPLVPLATGIFADTLYYTPRAGTLPVFTFFGALVTVVALLVHSRLRASIIGE